MTQPTKINFKVYQGSTFRETLRWESSTKVYSTITNISKTAPMVITSPTHGVVEGWRVLLIGVGGMKEVNTGNYIVATSVDQDTLTFNSINASNYTAYTSGGTLEYNQPVDLAGYTARMQIRTKLDSDVVVHELTTENGGITLDNTTKTIALTIPASTTQTFDFTSSVYSIELVNGSEVTPFATGNITLIKEVTR